MKGEQIFEELRMRLELLEDGEVEEIEIDEEKFKTFVNYIIEKGELLDVVNENYYGKIVDKKSIHYGEMIYYNVEGIEVCLVLSEESETVFNGSEVIHKRKVEIVAMFNNKGGELDILLS